MSQDEPNAVTNITGNSATATRLRNPRLINNVSFDGTSDIRIVDVSNATGGDGKLLPTQTELMSSIGTVTQKVTDVSTAASNLKTDFGTLKSDIKSSIDTLNTDFGSLKTSVNSSINDITTKIKQVKTDTANDIGTVESDFKTMKTDVNSTVSKMNTTLSTNTKEVNKELTDIKNTATELNRTVESNNTNLNQRVDDIQLTLSSYKPNLGEGQYRVGLGFRTGYYRVNSTGRPIQLSVLCSTDETGLFLLQQNIESPVNPHEDDITDLCSMTLTHSINAGTMIAVIPANSWWSIKWENTMTGRAEVISLQDRSDCSSLKYYFNGYTSFAIAADGSEDQYIKPTWTRL